MIDRSLTLTAILLTAATAVGPAPAQQPTPNRQDAAQDQAQAPAQNEDRQALARRIRQTVSQLQQLRTERRKLERQHDQHLDGLNERIAELRQQLSAVEPEAAAAQRRVDRLQTSIEQSEARKNKLRRSIREVGGSVARVADRLGRRIEHGIPLSRAERAGELRSISDRASGGGAGGRAGAIDDLFSFMGDELQRARSPERWNAPVRLDGGDRRVHAYQIRIGLVSQMFVGEDGQTVGLAAKRPDRPWRTDLETGIEKRIRAALDILRQRRPPQLTPVPIPRTEPTPTNTETTRRPSESGETAGGEGG